MKGEDNPLQLDRVDRPVRVAVEVVDQLEDPGTPEASKRLCVRVLAADLGQVERVAHDQPHVFGERLEVLPFFGLGRDSGRE